MGIVGALAGPSANFADRSLHVYLGGLSPNRGSMRQPKHPPSGQGRAAAASGVDGSIDLEHRELHVAPWKGCVLVWHLCTGVCLVCPAPTRIVGLALGLQRLLRLLVCDL